MYICVSFDIYMYIVYERRVDDKFKLSSGFNFFLSNFCAVCFGSPGERKFKEKERERECAMLETRILELVV